MSKQWIIMGAIIFGGLALMVGLELEVEHIETVHACADLPVDLSQAPEVCKEMLGW